MDVKEMEGWEGGMGRKERERCGEKRGDRVVREERGEKEVGSKERER